MSKSEARSLGDILICFHFLHANISQSISKHKTDLCFLFLPSYRQLLATPSPNSSPCSLTLQASCCGHRIFLVLFFGIIVSFYFYLSFKFHVHRFFTFPLLILLVVNSPSCWFNFYEFKQKVCFVIVVCEIESLQNTQKKWQKINRTKNWQMLIRIHKYL